MPPVLVSLSMRRSLYRGSICSFVCSGFNGFTTDFLFSRVKISYLLLWWVSLNWQTDQWLSIKHQKPWNSNAQWGKQVLKFLYPIIEENQSYQSHFLKWTISFFGLFNHQYNFTANKFVDLNSNHVRNWWTNSPKVFSIWLWDLNSKHLTHGSPHITTRQGYFKLKRKIWNCWCHFQVSTSSSGSNNNWWSERCTFNLTVY